MRGYNPTGNESNIERFCNARDMLAASEDGGNDQYLDLLSDTVSVAERYHNEVASFDNRVKTARFKSTDTDNYKSAVSRMDEHKRRVHEALISSFFAANRKIIAEAKKQDRLDEFVGGLYTADPNSINRKNGGHRDAIGTWAYELVEEIYDSGFSCNNMITLDDRL